MTRFHESPAGRFFAGPPATEAQKTALRAAGVNPVDHLSEELATKILAMPKIRARLRRKTPPTPAPTPAPARGAEDKPAWDPWASWTTTPQPRRPQIRHPDRPASGPQIARLQATRRAAAIPAAPLPKTAKGAQAETNRLRHHARNAEPRNSAPGTAAREIARAVQDPDTRKKTSASRAQAKARAKRHSDLAANLRDRDRAILERRERSN